MNNLHNYLYNTRSDPVLSHPSQHGFAALLQMRCVALRSVFARTFANKSGIDTSVDRETQTDNQIYIEHWTDRMKTSHKYTEYISVSDSTPFGALRLNVLWATSSKHPFKLKIIMGTVHRDKNVMRSDNKHLMYIHKIYTYRYCTLCSFPRLRNSHCIVNSTDDSVQVVNRPAFCMASFFIFYVNITYSLVGVFSALLCCHATF